jgi:hypothetical protein
MAISSWVGEFLELVLGNPPNKLPLPKAHIQAFRRIIAFPQDAVPTDYGADSAGRYVPPAWGGRVWSKANLW